MLRISMVEETQLDVIRDPGRAVQKLLNHMPRIVENQQRLGPILGQLACDHYGLEPQVNVFLCGHLPSLPIGTAPASQAGAVSVARTLTVRMGAVVPSDLNPRNQSGTAVLKHNVLRYSVRLQFWMRSPFGTDIDQTTLIPTGKHGSETKPLGLFRAGKNENADWQNRSSQEAACGSQAVADRGRNS